MKRLLYLLPFLALNLYAESPIRQRLNERNYTPSSLDEKFQSIDGRFKNAVNVFGDQFIYDDKTFVGLTVTATTTLQGLVVISSSIGSGTPTANAVYAEHHIIAMGQISVSGGTPSIAYGVNIASVTDAGAGRTVVNFDRNAASTSYVCQATPYTTLAEVIFDGGTQSTTGIEVQTYQAQTGAAVDNVPFFITCWGLQ